MDVLAKGAACVEPAGSGQGVVRIVAAYVVIALVVWAAYRSESGSSGPEEDS